MIFVACPYRDEDEKIENFRVDTSIRYAASLIKKKLVPFSAVAYLHHILKRYDLPSEVAYWEKFLYEYLKMATEVHVLKLDGWGDSEGLGWEIEKARELDIPVVYIDI